MAIQSINSVASPFISSVQPSGIKATPSEAQESFANMLKQSIDSLNKAQNQSDVVTEKLAKGEDVDLHQVMIASQKSSVSLSLALEVRNKAVEAYQEMMRMPV